MYKLATWNITVKFKKIYFSNSYTVYRIIILKLLDYIKKPRAILGLIKGFLKHHH